MSVFFVLSFGVLLCVWQDTIVFRQPSEQRVYRKEFFRSVLHALDATVGCLQARRVSLLCREDTKRPSHCRPPLRAMGEGLRDGYGLEWAAAGGSPSRCPFLQAAWWSWELAFRSAQGLPALSLRDSAATAARGSEAALSAAVSVVVLLPLPACRSVGAASDYSDAAAENGSVGVEPRKQAAGAPAVCARPSSCPLWNQNEGPPR